MAPSPADPPEPPPFRRGDPGSVRVHGLLERLHAGDASALDELLRVYWQPLVRYAYTLLGNLDAAEDAVQNVFVRLWHGRTNWRGIESIRAYLYRSTRNQALNEQRRLKVQADWAEEYRGEARAPTTPPETLEQQELHSAIEAAVASLSPRRREVFLLFIGHSLSYREIGAIMGISYQTVANHMSAALRYLRTSLREYAVRGR